MTDPSYEGLKFFTTEELSQIWHCNVRHISHLRMYGLLRGIKTGKYYMYSSTDIDQFWNTYRGFDLSNERKIRIAASQMKKTGTAGTVPVNDVTTRKITS